MAIDNTELNNSKSRADDEYYTLRKDVALELGNYNESFKGKRILCPCDYVSDKPTTFYEEGKGVVCDDENTSQFVKYLVDNAKRLGIKSVTASGYDPKTGKGVPFESLDLSNYDLIVTNPPFSKFNKFFNKLNQWNKDFLIVGHIMDSSLKDVSSAIAKGKVWTGYNNHFSGFLRPDGTLLSSQDYVSRTCHWFTNLPVKREERMPLPLTKSYKDNPKAYKSYVNFPGIEVSHIKDIPKDYNGYIGVPVSYIQVHNPKQFKIIGESSSLAHSILNPNGKKLNGRFYTIDDNDQSSYKRMPVRFIIQRTGVSKEETESLSRSILTEINLTREKAEERAESLEGTRQLNLFSSFRL